MKKPGPDIAALPIRDHAPMLDMSKKNNLSVFDIHMKK